MYFASAFMNVYYYLCSRHSSKWLFKISVYIFKLPFFLSKKNQLSFFAIALNTLEHQIGTHFYLEIQLAVEFEIEIKITH